jgi:hypothetical protein
MHKGRFLKGPKAPRGQAPKLVTGRHHLFHGELSDAPGRNESWDQFLCYQENNRWVLITEGTDFSGTAELEATKDSMSTRQLLTWVLERDDEIRDASFVQVEEPDESIEEQHKRAFGPYAERLREIAVEVGADYCVSCLDRWLKGAWPPVRNPPMLKILEVRGVTRRGIWIGIYHSVYDIETTLGPAYLYPPQEEGAAKLVLKTESSMSPGRLVKLSGEVLAKLEALRPELTKLNA